MYYIKSYILLIVLALTFQKVSSQNHIVDSLENLLSIHPERDTTRVKILNETSFYLFWTDKEKSMKYSYEAIEISFEILYLSGYAESLFNLGLNSHVNADYLNALEYYHRSMEVNEKLNDEKGIASCLNMIGTINMSSENYQVALEHFYEALEIRNKFNQKEEMANAMYNIAFVYEKRDKSHNKNTNIR